MNPPKCKVYPPSQRYSKKVVRYLRFNGEDLEIDIQGPEFSFARITFRAPVGFRVLDERDLCEFWNEYSEAIGWLYEVVEGGWMELESNRELFTSPSWFHELREFLIVDDKCISILTSHPPEISDLGTNPNDSPTKRGMERRESAPPNRKP